MIYTAEIDITGIVQGVGFRPFIYNLAKSLDLKGYILNRGNAGVRTVLQGSKSDLNIFINKVERERPRIAFIENIDVSFINSDNFSGLEIKQSQESRGISLTLPPDISMCNNCLNDMRNPKLSKYFHYPFVACAVCGPRFTTVKTLPYDRIRTTMEVFPFCKEGSPSCVFEYSNFENRRFHAQTFACSKCGPRYSLYDNSGKLIVKNTIEEILGFTTSKIKEGKIFGIKGIGGTHLVCLATDFKVVQTLRERKGGRKSKPFAVMIPSLDIVNNELIITDKESELLTSFRRPIVILKKRENTNSEWTSLSDIAPGLNNLGVMLPYSGIHHLIFDFIGDLPLIYTSGNPSNIPMAIDNEAIFKQLGHMVDYFLLHNRPIYQRADDSVLRVHGDKTKIIRRSRGYVPEYISLPFNVKIPGAIATGPELTVTGAILRKNRIFPTQHIGNVNTLETYKFLKQSIYHMKTLLKIIDEEVKYIAGDGHPQFTTTQLATELSSKFNVNFFPIQHHFAHTLSLMADNKVNRDDSILCLCCDGVGYGDDGNTWGGEILYTTYSGYSRLGHLEYQPMIGGDRCAKYPARMAASIILNRYGEYEAQDIFEKLNLKKDLQYGANELKAIINDYKLADNNFSKRNVPLTSSTGRIFDTVSYILEGCNLRTYRGEPAMRLEGFASRGNPNKVEVDINFEKRNGIYIIKTSELIQEILELMFCEIYDKQDIAASFQSNFARAYAELAVKIAREKNLVFIGLTGGVAYNYVFSNTIKNYVIQEGFIFLEHEHIPPGDAGVSIGQLIGGLSNYRDSIG